MKKHAFFCLQNLLLIQILLLIGLVSVNHSAFADGDIPESQIMRVAKIAKATGTDITIVRVTTTVKVYGSNKKTNKKVKRTVMKFVKPKKSHWTKVGAADSDAYDFASRPPADFENRPPVLSSSSGRPPVLEESSSPSHAPVLEPEAGASQGYF